jgi:hypothetical protein
MIIIHQTATSCGQLFLWACPLLSAVRVSGVIHSLMHSAVSAWFEPAMSTLLILGLTILYQFGGGAVCTVLGGLMDGVSDLGLLWGVSRPRLQRLVQVASRLTSWMSAVPRVFWAWDLPVDPLFPQTQTRTKGDLTSHNPSLYNLQRPNFVLYCISRPCIFLLLYIILLCSLCASNPRFSVLTDPWRPASESPETTFERPHHHHPRGAFALIKA